MFAGGNPISRVELDGHINDIETSEGSDTFVLPISTSDEEHNEQVEENWKNASAGVVEGVIETGEQANPFNSVRRMTGTADSQIYHNLLTGRGVDTEGAAYQTGRFGGSLLFPTGAAGIGVRVTDRAVASLTEKAAAKLADDVAMGADEAVGAGSYLLDKAFKAPGQVTPGTRLLEGEYVHDIGHGLIRVEPWKAHYDQYGRLIARTDYNAANNAHGIPEVHHHLYEWRAGCTPCHVDHIPGEFPG